MSDYIKKQDLLDACKKYGVTLPGIIWTQCKTVDISETWTYSADARPDKEGCYLCVLLYDEYEDSKPTGRKCAAIEGRYYGDIKDDIHRSWVMVDEPETGLVWTEECGSWMNEKVWAWMPEYQQDLLRNNIKLPDGVVWGDDDE